MKSHKNHKKNYQEFLNLFNEKDIKIINKFIKEKYITEKQLLRIANKSFQIKPGSNSSNSKNSAKKMLLSLSFVINSGIKEKDPKSYENFIKRLMKENGIDAAEEMIAHNFLYNYYKNYEIIMPLFSKNPDGHIKNNKEEIHVEIKTRNPEIFKKLECFWKLITASLKKIEYSTKKKIFCNIKINKINKFNDKIIFEEKEDFSVLMNKLKNIEPPEYPNIFCAKRKSQNITYNIELTYFKETPQNKLIMPSEFVDNCLFYTGFCKSYNKKFYGGFHINLTCSNEVKRFLSKKIIEKSLQSKNIPKRGIIVLYFNNLTNKHLSKMIHEISEGYIQKRPNKAIIGIKESIDSKKSQAIGKELAIGNNLKKILNKLKK